MKRPVLLRRRSVSIGMTPMVDVIFLLIIFFLCVNQYQQADSAEEIDLPTAESEQVSAPEPARHAPLVLNLRGDGEIHVLGRAIPIEQVGAALRHAQQETPLAADGRRAPLEVWLRADRRLPYRRVEPVLRACAQEGIWKVAFKVVTPDQQSFRGEP